MNWIGDRELGLVIDIGEWDRGLGLGFRDQELEIGIGDWNSRWILSETTRIEIIATR